MTGGIEVDAHVLLGLKVGQDGSDTDRMGSRGLQVIDVDIKMEHLLLLPGFLRPDGRTIPRLGLEGQAGPTRWASEHDPARLAHCYLPAEKSTVKIRQSLGIQAVEDHGGQ
jgi:hypothetical protein